MGKAVLISIRPRYCVKIANEEKPIEVRRNCPKKAPPFKVYIYCTMGKPYMVYTDEPYFSGFTTLYGWSAEKAEKTWELMNGKVIGEFICDHVKPILPDDFIVREDALRAISGTCLTIQEVKDYAGWKKGMQLCDCKPIYGWHISNLIIYDNPRELAEFKGLRATKFGFEPVALTRPPQSWCYVEEV